jgi:hypothetical protein
MSVIKIFDREIVCDSVCQKYGLINIVDVLKVPTVDVNNISDIINTFMCDKTFALTIVIACKICNLTPQEMAVYYIFPKNSYRGWFLHPILIKSILRYADESLNKCTIARIVYMVDSELDFYKTMSCSLLSIVENVKNPESIKRSVKGEIKYICKSIKDKNDMFNDDHLILECIQFMINDTLKFLPQCLCDLICSMVSI